MNTWSVFFSSFFECERSRMHCGHGVVIGILAPVVYSIDISFSSERVCECE